MNEEEIFEKPPPKKKRVLTEKQKEALAKGRAKVKSNRNVVKNMESQEIKQIEREEKRVLSKKQQEALETVMKNENKKNKLETWDDMKSKMLSTMPDVNSYDLLNNYLDKLSEDDIMDDKKLKNKIGQMAKHLHDRTLNL